jgi:hypothetical protein
MKVSALLNEYFERPGPRRSRIFEGPASDLPVSVKQKVWSRDEKGTGRLYEFSQREDMKDFVQAALDFDDETGTGFKFEIEGQRVHITLAVGEGYRSSDWSMAMLDSIYSEITGR